MQRSEIGVDWEAVAGFMNNEYVMELWDRSQEREKEPLQVNLVRPQSLIKTVNDVLAVIPNWIAITNRASVNKGIQSPNPKHSQVGVLAEIIVKKSFEELATDSKHKIHYDPIPPGTETEHYIFKHVKEEDDRLYAVEKETKRQVAEYDVIIEVNGRPALGEIKLETGIRHTGPREGKINNASLRKTIRNENINKRFAPLIELYGPRDFGYFIIISNGQISPRISLQRRFIDKGGIIAEFPMSNLDLQAKIPQLRGNAL